jgi:hypothetical protein
VTGPRENKQVVTLRLSVDDLERVRSLARRFRARESDVLRLAVKLTLARLAPLDEPGAGGVDVLPVFIDCGAQLTGHFELDSHRLDAVINTLPVPEGRRVDAEDVGLLALSWMPEHNLRSRLTRLLQRPISPDAVLDQLHQYLSAKYLVPESPGGARLRLVPDDGG